MTTLTTQLKALEQGGFSTDEINNWKQDKILTLENAGFESNEILAEFGYKPIDKNIRVGINELINGCQSFNRPIWRIMVLRI